MPNLNAVFPDFDKLVKITRSNGAVFIGYPYSHNGKGFQFIRINYDPLTGQVNGVLDNVAPANFANFTWDYV